MRLTPARVALLVSSMALVGQAVLPPPAPTAASSTEPAPRRLGRSELASTPLEVAGLRLTLELRRPLISLRDASVLELRVENPGPTPRPFALSELALVDARGVQPTYQYLVETHAHQLAQAGSVAPQATLSLPSIRLSESLSLPIRVYYGPTLLAEVVAK